MEKIRNPKEETIDIKAIILKYTQYWYYFLVSLLFCISIAFLYIRFTIPEYSVHTTLEIRDDDDTKFGAEYIIEGLEMFSGKNNLTNEIIRLKSYTITEKIVEELELGISYFKHGFFQTNELFNSSPFVVTIDSTHNQLVAIECKVKIIDNKKFNLKIKGTKHGYFT